MFTRKNSILLAGHLFVAILVACGNGNPKRKDAVEQNSPDEKIGDKDIIINGAGATFPSLLYMKWAEAYFKATGTKINYRSIGSGGGLAQIKARTVDFGASDAPLGKSTLDALDLIQFPLVIGGVVPVVNLDGIGSGRIKMTQKLIADIFLGKVTKWNDKAVQDVNPGLDLPPRKITVVYRSDASGTTWIFTNFLKNISIEWEDKVGVGKAVEWPVGMGEQKNEGVVAVVKRIPGAIGYVEFAHALQNGLTHVLLQNRAGTFVEPSLKSFGEAAANADWTRTNGFNVTLTDQGGHNAWPITGASFILIPKKNKSTAATQNMLRFFKWCYDEGGNLAKDLHYLPVSKKVVTLVEDLWKDELKINDRHVWK